MYSRCVYVASHVCFCIVLINTYAHAADSKATPVPASDNIAYGVSNTVDGGGGGPAVEGAEIRVEKNKAYVTFSPPQTAAGGPHRAGESGDEDVYDEIN